MIAVAFALCLIGFFLDASLAYGLITDLQWFGYYSTCRDIQFIGFSLLAFGCCPYSRTEIKVATFCLTLCRVAAALINICCIDPSYSPWFIYGTGSVFLLWMAKAKYMGEFETGVSQTGAYHIFFPIHSVWGLLQAIFLFWHPARYESRMVSDGKSIWCINKKQFKKYSVDELNIVQDHAKIYLGRKLTRKETLRLDSLVGRQAYPGVIDCRAFLV